LVKMYYDNDADLNLLKDKTIAVIGYGSQGHAQAQNLKDSGLHVIIGLRRDLPEWDAAVAYGFEVMSVAEAAEKAQIIQILVPDQTQALVYRESVAQHLTSGKALCFSHGFNIHFGQIVPPADVDVFMIAPKSPGHMVRRMYQEGQAYPDWLPYTRTPPEKPWILPWLMPKESAAPAPEYLKPHSKKKPRPTFLASRLFCAAVSLS